jgi:hypothetical protein
MGSVNFGVEQAGVLAEIYVNTCLREIAQSLYANAGTVI